MVRIQRDDGTVNISVQTWPVAAAGRCVAYPGGVTAAWPGAAECCLSPSQAYPAQPGLQPNVSNLLPFQARNYT